MAEKKQKVILDYSRSKPKRGFQLYLGLVAFTLCLLQWPWYWVADAIAWGMIWGDLGARGTGDKIVEQVLYSAPSIAAIFTAVWAFRRRQIRLDWIFGAIAFVVAITAIIWHLNHPEWY